MAYYKFRDGTNSLGNENVENFQMSSNNSKLWIGILIGILIFIIIGVIFYLKRRNANKQNFGFRFY